MRIRLKTFANFGHVEVLRALMFTRELDDKVPLPKCLFLQRLYQLFFFDTLQSSHNITSPYKCTVNQQGISEECLFLDTNQAHRLANECESRPFYVGV